MYRSGRSIGSDDAILDVGEPLGVWVVGGCGYGEDQGVDSHVVMS